MLSILNVGAGKLNWSMSVQGFVSAFAGFLSIYFGMEIISYIRAPRARPPLQEKLELTRKNYLTSVQMSYSIAVFSVFLIGIIFLFVIWNAGMYASPFIIGGSGIKDGIFLSGVYSTIFMIIFVVLGYILKNLENS